MALLLRAALSGSAETAGSVSGSVRFSGPTPARAPLPVFKHEEVCGASVPDDRLVVGPGGGLRFAVVTIDGVPGGRPPERDLSIQLDNRGCRFEPHVQVAEVGQWLEIRNSDPLLHNADARRGTDTLFNVALPPGRSVRKPLAAPGTIAITCDVRHTWMRAYIAVASHPYHTVSDAYGAYTITEVPPGTYTLRVWHEELGTTEQSVTVPAGGNVVVDVSLAAKEVVR